MPDLSQDPRNTTRLSLDIIRSVTDDTKPWWSKHLSKLVKPSRPRRSEPLQPSNPQPLNPETTALRVSGWWLQAEGLEMKVNCLGFVEVHTLLGGSSLGIPRSEEAKSLSCMRCYNLAEAVGGSGAPPSIPSELRGHPSMWKQLKAKGSKCQNHGMKCS